MECGRKEDYSVVYSAIQSAVVCKEKSCFSGMISDGVEGMPCVSFNMLCRDACTHLFPEG